LLALSLSLSQDSCSLPASVTGTAQHPSTKTTRLRAQPKSSIQQILPATLGLIGTKPRKPTTHTRSCASWQRYTPDAQACNALACRANSSCAEHTQTNMHKPLASTNSKLQSLQTFRSQGKAPADIAQRSRARTLTAAPRKLAKLAHKDLPHSQCNACAHRLCQQHDQSSTHA